MSAISTPCQIGESRGKRHDVCGGRGKQIPEFGGGFRRHDGPIMAENHRGGIAHLRGGQVFVAMHGVVVRTESMTQDIHRKLDPSIRGCLRKQEMPVSTDEREPPSEAQPCLEIFGNRDNTSCRGLAFRLLIISVTGTCPNRQRSRLSRWPKILQAWLKSYRQASGRVAPFVRRNWISCLRKQPRTVRDSRL